MSYNTIRNECRERFKRGIKDFSTVLALKRTSLAQASLLSSVPVELLEHVVHTGFNASHVLAVRAPFLPPSLCSPPKAVVAGEPVLEGERRFRVCIRKKPCEADMDPDFDCVSCLNSQNLVVHDGRLHRDGKNTYILHNRFTFDRVFSEHSDNEEVFQHTALPLVQHALAGNQATMLLFGQTGTGKTYTTFGVQHHIARHVFGEGGEHEGQVLTITAYEMMGKRCYDLLAQRAQITLLQASDGSIHAQGAQTHVVSSYDELMRVFGVANDLRAVRSMERNHASSRSHAICHVAFHHSGGKLTLVDLAGSEADMDTYGFRKEDHKESADINTALMTLKDCFRLFSQQARRVPFRGHPLTQQLRPCFEDKSHLTVLLATISARSRDLEHTLNSIRHVMHMFPTEVGHHLKSRVKVDCLKSAAEQQEELRFAKWDARQVLKFLQESRDGKFEYVASAGLDGKELLRLPLYRLVLMCQGNEEHAAELFELVRAEARRIDAALDARRSNLQRLLQTLPSTYHHTA